MSTEMSMEYMEIITMSVDKHAATKNYEVSIFFIDIATCIKTNIVHLNLLKAASQLIKSTMDKKFGAAWHCVIGEGFGFDITYQAKYMVYVYYGQIGVLVYKC